MTNPIQTILASENSSSLRPYAGHNHGALVVVAMPLESLRPNQRNPRLHNKRQIRQISKSIEAFGFNLPILVDEQNVIIAGHGRYEAAALLKMPDVPVIKLTHLSEAQVKAYMIADNRLAESSCWDETLLGQTLEELVRELDLSFTIETTGFEAADIDRLISQLALKPDTECDDTLPAVSDVAISKPGDCWVLGRHRVICGNSLDAATFDTLCEGLLAAMMFTDPPYNVPILGHVSGLGATQHREFEMATGEMSSKDFTGFLSDFLRLACRHLADGAILDVCMDWRHMSEVLSASRSVDLTLQNLCVWVKNNGGMGSLYRSQHELVFVLKKGAGPHKNNVQLGRFGRNRTNVWNYAGSTAFGRSQDEANLLALHPTVKPVALIADAILDCSSRNDLILDPFLGSGSTIIAAEKIGRTCYGIELDPLYVDTIIRRWEAWTGGEALHAVSGKNFSGSAEERMGTHVK